MYNLIQTSMKKAAGKQSFWKLHNNLLRQQAHIEGRIKEAKSSNDYDIQIKLNHKLKKIMMQRLNLAKQLPSVDK